MIHTTTPETWPDSPHHFLLPGPTGTLEVCSEPPKHESRDGTVIVCHPHSLHGGTLTNKVVHTITRCFLRQGLASVRFNFRGVGQSSGTFDNGIGETDDVLAVAAWLQKVRPQTPLWLAGFSFGAFVSARAATQLTLPLQHLISIAPPVTHFDFTPLPMPGCPWTIVQGDQDEVITPEAVYAWHRCLTPAPTLIRLPDASHFFHGQLTLLSEKLAASLQL